MSLSPGTRIGSYEIVALIGVGGMGEVYRARDSRLDRDVALKILPDAFASDQERRARFEREAKTLAALNHPHIAQVYGFEQSGTQAALVMELVEGEDLAERIKLSPIPLDEALPIARQIAEALEAAHDAGIVHRDLKPANIKVRTDGTVKVLDFGLAKAIEPGAGNREPGAGNAVANSPTITTPAMTMRGVVLGTAAYMAPEQAKGRFVDRRADIWAFGCVLYEMLTGARTFEGEDVSDTIVSVLRDDPRWQILPADTPPHVRTLLRRCLQKDPNKRLPHIGSARLELTDTPHADLPMAVTPAARSTARSAALWTLVGIAASAIVAMMAWPRATVTESAVVRFTITTPPGTAFVGSNFVPRFDVSPDGNAVIYQASDPQGSRFWIRSLDALGEVPLTGSEGPAASNTLQQPFWSPDGGSIAFFDENARKLLRMSRQGGKPQSIADITGNQLGGAWSPRGVILMASAATNGIQSIADKGGAVSQITTVNETQQESTHLWPRFLPDGNHFLYHVGYSGSRQGEIFVSSLDGRTPKKLVESMAGAVSQPPDRILFVREGALVSQRLDLTRLELIGEAEIVADAVGFTQAGRPGFSASTNGVIAYAAGERTEDTLETVWVDRQGRPLSPQPPVVRIGLAGLRLSRSGAQLAFGRASGFRDGRQVSEVAMIDLNRGIETRLGSVLVNGGLPAVLSPDASRVVLRRDAQPFAITEQSTTGAGPSRELIAEGREFLPLDWSADGKHVLIGNFSTRTLSVFSFETGTLTPYAQEYAAGGAKFSPDGKFVATAEGEPGSSERQIFVRTFPNAADGRWAVSQNGASGPRWRADGRELFYLSANGQVMSVQVTPGATISFGSPVPLFTIGVASSVGYSYDVSPDGQRFVTLRRREPDPEAASLVVLAPRPR